MSVQNIKTVAVIGTGVIGSSWTTLFLAKGFFVIVSDPAPNARSLLSDFIRQEWPRMERIGLAANADPANFEFVEDLSKSKHIHDIDFVQENAPERASFKTKLIGSLDALVPRTAIIASSSSGIPSSQFISECNVDSTRDKVREEMGDALLGLLEVKSAGSCLL